MAELDISAIPSALATALNIPLVAAALICVAVMMLVFVMPFVIMTRGRNMYAFLIPTVLVLFIGVGIGWIQYWVILLICLLVALLFAVLARDLITGR